LELNKADPFGLTGGGCVRTHRTPWLQACGTSKRKERIKIFEKIVNGLEMVDDERVNTAKTRRKVNPIFG